MVFILKNVTYQYLSQAFYVTNWQYKNRLEINLAGTFTMKYINC